MKRFAPLALIVAAGALAPASGAAGEDFAAWEKALASHPLKDAAGHVEPRAHPCEVEVVRPGMLVIRLEESEDVGVSVLRVFALFRLVPRAIERVKSHVASLLLPAPHSQRLPPTC